MASEIDKFVLQYQVDLKDAIQRLEQLNDKVTKVNEGAKSGKNHFAEFSRDAADEIGKLIPGVDKVSGAVKAMGAEFAVAAVAIAALGVGVKSVLDLRAQFGAQRLAGMDTGVSGLRMEEYQRKFIRNSGGMVNREGAQSEIKNLSERLQSAYSDPTRMGNDARTFRLLGVNVGAPGKGATGFNDAFGQLATRFSQMKPDQVQGVAKAIGMNQDFALTLQKIGPSISRVTELTAEDINKRQDAERSLAAFNSEMGRLNEQFNNLEIALGQRLIPAFTRLIELVNKVVALIPKAEDAKNEAFAGTVTNMVASSKDHNPLTFMNPAYGLYNYVKNKFGLGDSQTESKPDEAKKNPDPTKPTSTDLTPPGSSNSKADQILDGLDRNNQSAVRTSTDMQNAIQMFSGAVSTFANAIDERQAWAAWAGEAGRAAGLAAPVAVGGSGLPGVTRAVGATAYDAIFEKEAREQGVSVDLIKKIARQESSFNPNAKSSAGAEGLMQVMPANKKGLGVTDLMDPAQNIHAGTKLFKQYLDASGGNVRQALMMYHGGPNRDIWGRKTMAYPDQVLGAGMEGGGGESRQTTNLNMVQANIAARLGVPLAQLQQGAVNKGDVSWASSQMQAGVENQIFNLNKELMNPMLPQQTRSKIMNELREQQNGLQLMKQYAPQVEGVARPGDRSITIGERAITINVNGVQDPKQMTQMLDDHLQSNLGDIINHAADGIKY